MDSWPAPRGASRNDGVCSGGSVNGLLCREAPAGAGNIHGGDINVLFETHELPVAGALPEAVARLAGGGDHGVVGAQRIAKDGFGAEGARAAFQIGQQGLAEPLTLKTVVDRKAEFEAR